MLFCFTMVVVYIFFKVLHVIEASQEDVVFYKMRFYSRCHSEHTSLLRVFFPTRTCAPPSPAIGPRQADCRSRGGTLVPVAPSPARMRDWAIKSSRTSLMLCYAMLCFPAWPNQNIFEKLCQGLYLFALVPPAIPPPPPCPAARPACPHGPSTGGPGPMGPIWVYLGSYGLRAHMKSRNIHINQYIPLAVHVSSLVETNRICISLYCPPLGACAFLG
jgi:hypothetical protein